MLTARTKQEVSVAIDDADLKQTYYCPICRQPLIQKGVPAQLKDAYRGKILSPHNRGVQSE